MRDRGPHAPAAAPGAPPLSLAPHARRPASARPARAWKRGAAGVRVRGATCVRVRGATCVRVRGPHACVWSKRRVRPPCRPSWGGGVVHGMLGGRAVRALRGARRARGVGRAGGYGARVERGACCACPGNTPCITQHALPQGPRPCLGPAAAPCRAPALPRPPRPTCGVNDPPRPARGPASAPRPTCGISDPRDPGSALPRPPRPTCGTSDRCGDGCPSSSPGACTCATQGQWIQTLEAAN